MKAIRTMISQYISVAVIVFLMICCLPFMKLAMGGMFDTYGTMAAAVMDGEGGQYADNMVSKMEAGSQVLVGELGDWATSTIEQVGGSELLESITDFFEGLN